MHQPVSAPKIVRRPLHGVLLVDKPVGLSSNQVLQKCKWLLRAQKAGHTGTLDPLASGVLPLCFGAATKFSRFQLDADKSYVATLRLGVKTSTADAEGEAIRTRPVPPITAQRLDEIAARFTGALRQVPPMHSALKKDGKALYEYARAGEEVERQPRDVVVHRLRLTPLDPCTVRLDATVSKGTYIRTLGEDIGEALGCGAHLSSLRRTATGHFDVEDCVALEALEAMPEEDRVRQLRPIETLLEGHERITLSGEEAGRFLSGLRRRGEWSDHEHVAVYGPAATSAGSQVGTGPAPTVLLGTAHTRAGELIPDRLLSPPEISQILEHQS